MPKVIPIRPTVGMCRLDQLRAFTSLEQEYYPDRLHIAAWALAEIEILQDLVKELRPFIPHNGDGVDCVGCKLEIRIANTLRA